MVRSQDNFILGWGLKCLSLRAPNLSHFCLFLGHFRPHHSNSQQPMWRSHALWAPLWQPACCLGNPAWASRRSGLVLPLRLVRERCLCIPWNDWAAPVEYPHRCLILVEPTRAAFSSLVCLNLLACRQCGLSVSPRCWQSGSSPSWDCALSYWHGPLNCSLKNNGYSFWPGRGVHERSISLDAWELCGNSACVRWTAVSSCL